MPAKYDEVTKAKAVRLVVDHRDDYDSEWAAIKAVSARLGMTAETLRKWIRQAAVDRGEAEGTSTESARIIREQKRKIAELEQTIEILSAATSFFRAGQRPATPLVCEFLAEHKARFPIAAMCRALTGQGITIAPRTFHAWARRAPSKRELWDTALTEVLAGIYEPDEQGRRKPECLYGAEKMWAHLQRQGIPAARCTIERLMRVNGWKGVVRRRKVRTTEADPAASRAPDLVDRHFRVAAPNMLVVADFTYVALAGGGFVYTAFVIDAYAGRILGWECATSKESVFVESTIRQAAALRLREGNPLGRSTVHHSDAGSQFRSRKFCKLLSNNGLRGSTGRVAACADNAAMESWFALLQRNVLDRKRWATREELRLAMAVWIERTYHRRRRQRGLARLTPIEYETLNQAPLAA
ncbi:IS3 family transposase [Nocardia seriolae]|uniref:IS3 family transposase n=1 Tax=Nocardia seriolae TaxID=37332 RepID=UPI001D16E49C|nr:IS3 family transposase [Nocardia seriolae]WNJ60819.1 IS3 family transposase [Nocardia seriolae]